jgi:hypothetical protein
LFAGIFKKFYKEDGGALFYPFFRSIQNLYSTLERILGGTSYVDLISNQNIYTPILSNNNIDISSSAFLTDFSQITTPPLDAFPQISEIDFTRLDNTIPGPSEGSLAYGIYNNSSSTLYYRRPGNNTASTSDGSYELVKLGWPHGTGVYNSDATPAQRFSGWCHGTGTYKIVTSNQYCDISFDHILVHDIVTGAKDYVIGYANNPLTDYNIRIDPGTTGLNGIEAGSFTSSTGYYVWVVYNVNTQEYGAVLSTSGNTVTPPSDFNYVNRIGWVQASSVSGFNPSLQINDRFCFITDPLNLVSVSSSTINTTSSIFTPLITNAIPEGLNYPNKSFINSVDIKLKVTSLTSTSSTTMLEFTPITTIYASTLSLLAKNDFERTLSFFAQSNISNNGSENQFSNVYFNESLSNNNELYFGVFNTSTQSSHVATISYQIKIPSFELRNILIDNL